MQHRAGGVGGTGGGNTGWVFTGASILASPQGRSLMHADLRKAGIAPTGLPDGVVFPDSLVDFRLALSQPGSDASAAAQSERIRQVAMSC